MSKKNINTRLRLGKSILAILLILGMSTGSYNLSNAYNVQIASNYMALQANKIDLNENAMVKGFVADSKKDDYSSAIYYLLTTECTMMDSVSGTGDYTVEKPIHCSSNVNLKIDSYIGKNSFAADKNIKIKCSNFCSDECVFLYSKKGNISIDCDTFDFNGIICAPNGNVSIKAKSVKLSGSIIGKNVTVKADSTVIEPTKESNQLYVFLESYKNEGYMLFDAYVEEGNLIVYCEPNLEMDRGIVFVRYKGEKKFSELGEFKTNEGKIENFDFEEQVDIIVKGKTVFDEDILSDVITLAKDETGEIYCEQLDSDNDGIADGVELYYLESNPDVADTDKDGISDGVEVCNLYTDPTKPDKITNDFDRDGVTNIEEVRKGTDPYLRDTDFDGEKDKGDSMPRGYKKGAEAKYIPTTASGKFDRIVTTINEDGSCTQKLFDFINEKVRIESNGEQVTSYHYDYDLKLATKITSYKGEVKTNHYEYDGKKLTAIYNNGYKYGFNYDEKGGIDSITLNDMPLISYSSSDYDSSVIYANGDLQTFNYLDNQITAKATDGSNYTYIYDEESKTEKYDYEDSGLSVSYVYDENEELVRVETNTNFIISYDTIELENGYESCVTYAIGDDTYQQNNRTTYTEEGSWISSATLINGENVTRYFESENTVMEKLKVNDNNYFKRIVYGNNYMPKKIKYGDGIIEEYTYDSKDNITKIKENSNLVKQYDYDDRNRLISAKNLTGGTIDMYEYDLCDNIKAVQTYTYSDGIIGDLISADFYEYSDTYKDQLAKFNGTDITYDANGKPLTYYDGTSFNWNGDKLIGAVCGEKEISFMHNAEEKVIKKTVNGVDTTYCVEGKDYIAETTDGKTITYMYDGNANLIGFTYEGNAYYYVKNALNDIIRIVDSANQFVCGYAYDAYGKLLSISGNDTIGNLNKYRYRSYYFDTDLGMYYLQSRYYDSNTRRFISTDKPEMVLYAEDNLNLYAYCKGNPVYYMDPEGTTVRAAVLATYEFEDEAKNIQDDIEKYYYPETVKFATYIETYDNQDMQVLGDYWNKLSGRSLIIIDSHGSADALANEKGRYHSPRTGAPSSYYLRISDIEDLSYKSAELVILLGCNAGHYDVKNNVAAAFSRRVMGHVLACDGYVKPGKSNNNLSDYVTFYSTIADDNGDFKERCSSTRLNYGWIFYRTIRINGELQKTKTGIYTMGIRLVLNYLKNNYGTNLSTEFK